MATTAIGLVSVVPGIPALLGPYAADGASRATLHFELAAVLPTLTIAMEAAPDGVTFTPLTTVDCRGAGLQRDLSANQNLDCTTTLSSPLPVGGRVQVRLTTTTAFAGAGGSIQVS